MTNLSQLKLRMSRKRLDAELQILKCIISDDICRLFVVVDNSKIAKITKVLTNLILREYIFDI